MRIALHREGVTYYYDTENLSGLDYRSRKLMEALAQVFDNSAASEIRYTFNGGGEYLVTRSG